MEQKGDLFGYKCAIDEILEYIPNHPSQDIAQKDISLCICARVGIEGLKNRSENNVTPTVEEEICTLYAYFY